MWFTRVQALSERNISVSGTRQSFLNSPDKHVLWPSTRRFTGMLAAEQMQQFLVRAVTGMGERVQGKDISDAELKDIGAKIRTLAGIMANSPVLCPNG